MEWEHVLAVVFHEVLLCSCSRVTLLKVGVEWDRAVTEERQDVLC